MSYKIVAIKEMSAGNDRVGNMWKETKIFDSTTPLNEVMQWVGRHKQVTITIPDDAESVEEFESEAKF